MGGGGGGFFFFQAEDGIRDLTVTGVQTCALPIRHPLGLSLDDVEKGIATIRQMAAKAGRRDELKFAPRNLLNLTPDAKGRGRASFEGSPDEVVADIRRARALGVAYLTFAMPKLDVPGMVRTLQRFVKDVKPASA